MEKCVWKHYFIYSALFAALLTIGHVRQQVVRFNVCLLTCWNTSWNASYKGQSNIVSLCVCPFPTQGWCLRLWLPPPPHLSPRPRCRTTSWRRASTLWELSRLPQRPCLPQQQLLLLLLRSLRAAHLRPLVALMHQVSQSNCTFSFFFFFLNHRMFVLILEVLLSPRWLNISLTDCCALSSCSWASSTRT